MAKHNVVKASLSGLVTKCEQTNTGIFAARELAMAYDLESEQKVRL